MKKYFIAFFFVLLSVSAVKAKDFEEVDWRTVTVKEIDDLIQAKANINSQDKNGHTPLMLAILNSNDSAVVEALIKAGSNVNFRNETAFGLTPLMCAASSNKNEAVIKLLVKAGADVNARSEKLGGTTPLMMAAAYTRNPAVVEALIAAKANIKARDAQGKTAFDHAQKNKSIVDTPVYQKLRGLKAQDKTAKKKPPVFQKKKK